MKKVGAILAAGAMVVVAFVIRGSDDSDAGGDRGSGDRVTRLICPTEFKDICDEIDGVEVSFESAGETADRLLSATNDQDTLDGQAWVIPSAWAELVIETRRFNSRGDPEVDPRLFVDGDAIASTTPALAIYTDIADEIDCPEIDWTCLSDTVGGQFKVATPAVDSATGLPLLAAQLVEIARTSSPGRNDVRLLPAFSQVRSAFTVMRTRQGAYAAAATTEAESHGVTESPTGLAISMIRPGEARIDLVIVTRADEFSESGAAIGQRLDDDVEDAITRAFLDAGWSDPQFSDDFLPGGDILNLIREASQ